jgi:hypothetical protein
MLCYGSFVGERLAGEEDRFVLIAFCIGGFLVACALGRLQASCSQLNNLISERVAGIAEQMRFAHEAQYTRNALYALSMEPMAYLQ